MVQSCNHCLQSRSASCTRWIWTLKCLSMIFYFFHQMTLSSDSNSYQFYGYLMVLMKEKRTFFKGYLFFDTQDCWCAHIVCSIKKDFGNHPLFWDALAQRDWARRDNKELPGSVWEWGWREQWETTGTSDYLHRLPFRAYFNFANFVNPAAFCVN